MPLHKSIMKQYSLLFMKFCFPLHSVPVSIRIEKVHAKVVNAKSSKLKAADRLNPSGHKKKKTKKEDRVQRNVSAMKKANSKWLHYTLIDVRPEEHLIKSCRCSEEKRNSVFFF